MRWLPVAFLVGLLALSAEVYCHRISDHIVFSQQKVLESDSACLACIALPGYLYSVTALW